MRGYPGAAPGAIMVAMCHISHRRYREDAWSRGGWTWIEASDEPDRRDPDLRVSQAERDAFRALHMPGWGPSDFDGSYGSMSSSTDRRYASRAYGMERTRYS